MAHARTQIRDALKTLLTGLATTGARVFSNRVEMLEATAVPALIIRTGSEESSADLVTVSNAEVGRRLTIAVEAVINDGNDDTLDQIALEVETAIATDPTLAGRVAWLEYRSTVPRLVAEGDGDHAEIEITFEALYFTSRTNPAVFA